MSRDTGRDDPALRLERGLQQLLAWLDGRDISALEAVVRASAHLLRHACSDDAHEAEQARALLQRAGERGVPPHLAHQTLFAQVCLQANEVLGDRLFLDAAHSVCEGLLHWPRDENGAGVCLSAVPGRLMNVHHANLQAAAVLAEVGLREGRDEFLALARRAAAYSCARQQPDGSWQHGEAPHLRWIDHFHLGSQVASLAALVRSGVAPQAPAALERAATRLVAAHFDAQGCPKVEARATPPVEADVLVAADALDALGHLVEATPAVVPLVVRLADWTARHLQPWSLWRDPATPHGPARIARALARAQAVLLAPAGPPRAMWVGYPVPARVGRPDLIEAGCHG